MEAVRGFKVRLIVSTDVMARGVDFDRVNLVVNVDLPPDPATYVHRYVHSFRPGAVLCPVLQLLRACSALAPACNVYTAPCCHMHGKLLLCRT